MFERFTQDARNVVVAAQQHARQRDDVEITRLHLLLALVSAGPVSHVLAKHGLDADQIRRSQQASGLDDAQALAAIGIDLDAIRESVESTFGSGALDDDAESSQDDAGPAPGSLRGRLGRPRKPQPSRDHSTEHVVRGRHIPFSAGAKKSLELSLREAIRLQDRWIGSAHIALALLRDPGPHLTATLHGIDLEAVGRDLEVSRRRSA